MLCIVHIIPINFVDILFNGRMNITIATIINGAPHIH